MENIRIKEHSQEEKSHGYRGLKGCNNVFEMLAAFTEWWQSEDKRIIAIGDNIYLLYKMCGHIRRYGCKTFKDLPDDRAKYKFWGRFIYQQERQDFPEADRQMLFEQFMREMSV